ncbi:MAG: hypothetical protein GXP08_17855 [Gammaproteobacteria bacterium]|nr:hypothetical protein [Gammaproteobacteria bacterium]
MKNIDVLTMEKANADKRVFPRIETECPVLYSVGSSRKWRVAILMNMSATGILMKTKEQLLDDIAITIMTKPGNNRLVPAIIGKGMVTRCKKQKGNDYEISCKLTEVKSRR